MPRKKGKKSQLFAGDISIESAPTMADEWNEEPVSSGFESCGMKSDGPNLAKEGRECAEVSDVIFSATKH